jgi:hypothetical protein
MSNLGRIYEFLSKATASQVQLAATVEHFRLPCGLAVAERDRQQLWHGFRQCPVLRSVISLGPVHAE